MVQRPTRRFAAFLALTIGLAAPAAAETVLYAGATVIDGTGGPARPATDILVEDERIVAVGPRLRATKGARTVDLRGRTIIPGLIDSHVHMATPPDRVRAEAMLRRNLYGGVTQVRDMADDVRAVAELARASRAGEIAAPDIAFAALMAGPPFFADPRVAAASKGYAPGTAPWMQAIDDRTDLRQAVMLARGTSATAIKIYADLPPRLVKAITTEAHRQGLLVWSHSAVFPTRPADVIAAAPDSVSHVCYLAYQTQPVMLAAYEDRTPVDETRLAATGDDPVLAGLYRDMLKHGTILDATGSLFVNGEAERRADPTAKPLRCTGAAVIRLTAQAWRAGVPIATGTDHVAPPDHAWPEVFDELHFLARDVGIPPLQVIRAATAVGALAAGLDADMGTIAPRKLANFVVLTRDPLTDIANIESVETVVKRGRAYPRTDYAPAAPAS
jgi:imidazolonepropionase-like amidohydrolase